jgi:hypothetical protein
VDDTHLDALTRSLAAGRTRRALARLLAGVTGGLLPLVVSPESESKKRRSKRQRKRKRRRGKATSDPGGAGDDSPRPDSPARRPFPRHVTYAGGTILPDHRSQQQLDDDVRAAYDRWKQRYLVPVTSHSGATLYRVAFGKPGTSAHNTTVSEGQGYGMVIVPLMAGQVMLQREGQPPPHQREPRLDVAELGAEAPLETERPRQEIGAGCLCGLLCRGHEERCWRSRSWMTQTVSRCGTMAVSFREMHRIGLLSR